MTLRYLDPAAESTSVPEAYDRRLDISRRPLTLGLVANSFPDSTNFMDCLERSLATVLPGATFKRFQKSTVEPMSEKMLAEVVASCDGVVASWGH